MGECEKAKRQLGPSGYWPDNIPQSDHVICPACRHRLRKPEQEIADLRAKLEQVNTDCQTECNAELLALRDQFYERAVQAEARERRLEEALEYYAGSYGVSVDDALAHVTALNPPVSEPWKTMTDFGAKDPTKMNPPSSEETR